MSQTSFGRSLEGLEDRYNAEKFEKAKRIGTRRLHGVPLAKMDKSLSLETFNLPFPVIACLCVQDSPENPCPCTKLILWLLEMPLSVERTGRKHSDGKEILEFMIGRDAKVSVELQVPMKLSQLDQIAALSQRRRRCGHESGTAAAPAPTSAPPPLGWLGLAGSAGYAVGSLLDDLLGSNEGGNDNLSDDLSDWAAENFPAPDWLQDLF